MSAFGFVGFILFFDYFKEAWAPPLEGRSDFLLALWDKMQPGKNLPFITGPKSKKTGKCATDFCPHVLTWSFKITMPQEIQVTWPLVMMRAGDPDQLRLSDKFSGSHWNA